MDTDEKTELLEMIGAEVNEETLNSIKKNARLLGQYVNIDGYKGPSVTYRMNIARKTYKCLRAPFFRNHNIPMRLKNAVFQAIIDSSLFYGLETHTLSENEITRLQRFINGRTRDYTDLGDTLMRAKVWTNELGQNEDIEIISNDKIAKEVQLPNARTWLQYRRLNHIISQTNNNTIASQIIAHKMEQETNNMNGKKPKCKQQADRPKDGPIMDTFHKRLAQYKQAVQEIKMSASLEEQMDIMHISARMNEKGFLDYEKIQDAIIKNNYININCIPNFTFPELCTQHPLFIKNITRVILSWDPSTEDHREKVLLCLGCEQTFVSQRALGTHFAKCEQYNRKDCFKPYQRQWSDQQLGNSTSCPWGSSKDACKFPNKARLCPLCRNCSGIIEAARQRRKDHAKKTRELHKSILDNTNQQYVTHENQKIPDKCPHKRKTCKWPDKSGWWCVKCVKNTGFKPIANEEREAKRAMADRQLAEDSDSSSC